MKLNSIADLSIAELVFWAPAMLVLLYLCFRQGFSRQSAWFWLAVLSLCRLISAGTYIAFQQGGMTSSALGTATAITNALGISFLLSALVGIQVTLLEHGYLGGGRKIPRLTRMLYCVILVGIILSIVGGIKITGSNVTAADYSAGYKLIKVAAILYLVVWIILGALLAVTFVNLSSLPSDKALFVGAAVSMPFTFIRLLYIILAAFLDNSTFNILQPDVWTEAFMEAMQEFIVGIIVIVVGFVAAPNSGKKTKEPMMYKDGVDHGMQEV